MLKSIILSCLIFIFIYNASSQESPLMVNSLPLEIKSSFSGNQNEYNKKNLEIANRSGIRAVLDTVKEFRQTDDFSRQIRELHYGFDSSFNINFIRYLVARDNQNKLIPVIQTKSEFHSSGQFLRDTSYLFSIQDGIWINYQSRQNKFDGDGNNVVSSFEEWSDFSGKWNINSIVDRVFNNGLLKNMATRRSNGQGGSANSLESFLTWQYESPFGWTKNQHFFFNHFQGLVLWYNYTRDFDQNGNIINFYVNDIDDPERLNSTSEKYHLQYDDNNRLIQETRSISSPPMQVWQLRTRKIIGYYTNNKISMTSMELWDSIINDWNLQSYSENELDSYGNIILETHYKTSPISPGTYILDKTVEYIYDLDFNPGSFVANEEVDHDGHMLIKSVTTAYGDSTPVISSKEFIYKILQSNSIESNLLASVYIFPNPFSDYVQIEVGTPNFQELNLEIYNIKGILCLKQKVHPKESVMVAELISGSYTMVLMDPNGRVLSSRKMVKR